MAAGKSIKRLSNGKSRRGDFQSWEGGGEKKYVSGGSKKAHNNR